VVISAISKGSLTCSHSYTANSFSSHIVWPLGAPTLRFFFIAEQVTNIATELQKSASLSTHKSGK